MMLSPIIIEYDVLCSMVDEAERNRGKVQKAEFKDGYTIEFSIQETVCDFWVRKFKIWVNKGCIHPDAFTLLAKAFKIPVSDRHMQEIQESQSFEIFGEADAQNCLGC